MWWLALVACSDSDPVLSGDPDAGWDVLRYGDFVGAGVPADLWFDLVPNPNPANELEREGRSAELDRSYNLFEAPNGVEVVGGLTCMGCHAAEVEGTFIAGLGDARIDFSSDVGVNLFGLVETVLDATYGPNSPEAEAATPFIRGGRTVTPATITPFAGVNPAFSLERAAAAHREPDTLRWLDTPSYEIPATPIWSDTPPLWHAKRRDSLYWTGFGLGQRERLILQISIVAIEDASQAERILPDFSDVVAWLEALEPPPYPGPLDAGLANDGEAPFVEHCSRCHGTYGNRREYPEVIVPLEEIGTDPVYARAFDNTPFTAWLEDSWFGSAGNPGKSPAVGYVAPPLDGIWATAPYFHNGSVPDLRGVLDPAARPATWRRDPTDTTLDHTTMGWPYTDAPADEWLYDTSVEGASNAGHRYGEALTADERTAVLEYLKTL
ncbi:MAG: hypothetical protein AAGA48_05860 [Myxococcota bacterium]